MAQRPRTWAVAGSTLTAAALAISTALPAQAAPSPGWRVVFSHHYGAAAAGSVYWALSAAGKRDAWAVGGSGGNGGPGSGSPVAVRWHDGAWHISRLPSGLAGLLPAVSADSGSDAWAVSSVHGYVLHYNGTGWSVAKKWPEGSPPKELTGVTALSPADVWVFGGPGFKPGLGTWHYNGRSWHQTTTAPGNGIVAASALSATNIWAIGSVSAPQGSIVHYTGTWRQTKASALSGLAFQSILALARSNVWAAASLTTDGFKSYLVHMTGSGWVRIKVPWLVDSIGLASDGHGGVWLTAQNSTGQWAIHRSASGRWSRIPIGPHASMFGLSLIPGTTTLWGAGSVRTSSGSSAAVFAYGRVG